MGSFVLGYTIDKYRLYGEMQGLFYIKNLKHNKT